MISAPSTIHRLVRRLALCAMLVGASTAFDGVSGEAQDPARRAPDTRRSFLAEAFPQTSALLDHLATADPKLHAQLQAHSETLLRNSESEALEFAREHHPELAKVLDSLRTQKKRRRAYDRAIREVVRDSRRIQQQKRRAPRTYEATIEAWKSRSRLRLLAARIANSAGTANSSAQGDSSKQANSSVETLVRDLHRYRRRGLERRIERLKRQMGRLEKQLGEDPEAAVQREVRSIRTKIERRKQR